MNKLGMIQEMLFLGTELSTQVAEIGGAKVFKNAKSVVIDLTKPKPHLKKLWNIFCPDAKAPKLEVSHNMNEGIQKGIAYRFKDGNAPLSGAEFNYANDGSISFNFNIVNSATRLENISASGHYNPKAKFFDWNDCGETIQHRHGKIITSVDSTGFAINTSINDKSAFMVIDTIKNFLRNLG